MLRCFNSSFYRPKHKRMKRSILLTNKLLTRTCMISVSGDQINNGLDEIKNQTQKILVPV